MGRRAREQQALRGKGRVVDDASSSEESGENNDGRAAFAADEVLDQLLENSAGVRVSAFQALSARLRTVYSLELCERARTTLESAVLRACKRGGHDEQLAALTVTRLWIMTVGSNDETLFATLSTPLRALIETSASAAVQQAAVETLALATFVAASDDAACVSLLDLYAPLLDAALKQGAGGVESALALLRAWGVVASVVAADVMARSHLERHLLACELALESTSAEVHVAAASNAALLIDVWRDAMSLGGQSTDVAECACIDVSEFCDRVAALASAASKQAKAAARNKRDWRASLRAVADYLEALLEAADDENADVEPPAEVFVVQHQNVTLSGFAELVQLEFFRGVLAGGFLEHMTRNELLHDIFSLDIAADATATSLSQVEKRRLMSPNSAASKTRTNKRGKGRHLKLEKNTLVLNNADED